MAPHIPWVPILYGLLVVVLVAAVVISIWWSSRLRRPAAPLVIEDVGTEELREAVEPGRAALAEIDDARAAIIACYVAMERSLADRGTAPRAADTPDEFLARAVAAGTVRGRRREHADRAVLRGPVLHPPARRRPAGRRQRGPRPARRANWPPAAPPEDRPTPAGPGRSPAEQAGQPASRAVAGHELAPRAPELIIAAVLVAAAALAGAAVAGWPGVVVVAAAAAVHRPAGAARRPPQVGRPDRRAATKDKQQARAISGYAPAPVHRRHQPDQPPDVRVGPAPGPRAHPRRPAGREPRRQPLHRAGRRPAGVLPHPARREPLALDRPGAGPRRRRAIAASSAAFPAGPSPA